MVAFRSRSCTQYRLVHFGYAANVGSKAVDRMDVRLSKDESEGAKSDCVGIFIVLLFFVSILMPLRIIFIWKLYEMRLS